VALEANGLSTTFDIAAAQKSTCRNPAIGTVTATVANNLLTVAVRAISTDKTQSAPYLNTLEISPQTK
jgi:hypothetical protein